MFKHKAWLILLVLLAVPTISFAQIWTGPAGTSTCNLAGSDPCDLCDLAIVAANTYWLIVQMVLVLGIIFIIAGAIIMLSGAFSPSWHEMGKSAITWAIIGIAVAILSWVLINTVFYFLADEEYRGWGTIDCTMFDFLTAVPSAPPIVPPPPPEPPPDPDDPLQGQCARFVTLGVNGCIEVSAFADPLGIILPDSEAIAVNMPWSGGPTGRESGNANTVFALITEEVMEVRISAPDIFEWEEGFTASFVGWAHNVACVVTGTVITCQVGIDDQIMIEAAYEGEGPVEPTLTLQDLAAYFLVPSNRCDTSSISCGVGGTEIGPCDNLRETVNGEALTVCSPSCTPSSGCSKDPSVTLNHSLLQAMYDLHQQPGVSFIITSLATGPHVTGSLHYQGNAVDISAASGITYQEMETFFTSRGFRVLRYATYIHVETIGG